MATFLYSQPTESQKRFNIKHPISENVNLHGIKAFQCSLSEMVKKKCQKNA